MILNRKQKIECKKKKKRFSNVTEITMDFPTLTLVESSTNNIDFYIAIAWFSYLRSTKMFLEKFYATKCVGQQLTAAP